MNAFEDGEQPAGDYVSFDRRNNWGSSWTKQRFTNIVFFLLGVSISVLCVFFYGTIYGFGGHSKVPAQTYPGQIPITSASISGSSCLINWERIFVSNSYQLILFQLALSDNAQRSWVTLQLANSGFDFARTVEGLRSSTEYIFRLRGCADVGCGNFTYTQCRTGTPSVPKTPEAPTISSLTQTADKVYLSLNVTSADNGGVSISKVELRWAGLTNNWVTNTSLGCSFWQSCSNGCNCTVPVPIPFLGSETFSFRTQVSNYIGTSDLSIPTQCTIFTDSNRYPLCVVRSPPAVPLGLSTKTGVYNVSFRWNAGISVNSVPPTFFQVWLSDPWNNHQEVVRITNVTSYTYWNNTLLPDTVYKFAVQAFDDVLRAGQLSKCLVFKTLVRGACGNHQDIKALKTNWDSAPKKSNKCWKKDCEQRNTPTGEDCTEQCIERTLGFTKGCSKCWFERTTCLSDKCRCILEPTKCQSCYNELCLDSYLNCTGLPPYASPPTKLN